VWTSICDRPSTYSRYRADTDVKLIRLNRTDKEIAVYCMMNEAIYLLIINGILLKYVCGSATICDVDMNTHS